MICPRSGRGSGFHLQHAPSRSVVDLRNPFHVFLIIVLLVTCFASVRFISSPSNASDTKVAQRSYPAVTWDRPRSHPSKRVLQSGSSSRPLYVFVHIPKTAGTTFRLKIAKYNEYLDTHSLRICSSYLNQPPIHPDGLRFLELSLPQQDECDLLIGHFPFNYHLREGFKVGNKTHWNSTRSIKYLTILREPIDRVASLYNFYRNIPNRQNPSYLEVANRTLGEWIEWNVKKNGLASDQCNLETQYLSGVIGVANRETLEMAKRNLQDFYYFGLQERFAESLVLLKYRMGWQLPKEGFDSSNVKPRPSLKDEDEAAIQLIRDCNPYDTELYEFASQLFETRLRQHLPWSSEDFDFQAELEDIKEKIRFQRPLASA